MLVDVAEAWGVALNHREALLDAMACGHVAVKAWEKRVDMICPRSLPSSPHLKPMKRQV